jgi:hypothetical protein
MFKWVTINNNQPGANVFITFRVKYKFGVRNTTSVITAPRLTS